METIITLNRIEILGGVGNIRLTTFDDRRCINMSVVTNYIYKGRDAPVIETMWFNVTGWEGSAVSAETLDSIQRGNNVHVVGRLRERTYALSDGTEKHITEVVATSIELVKDTDVFQMAKA